MSDCLFERVGEQTYRPTELTRGGWSDDTQHGGPPCGLLAHAIDQVPTPVDMWTVRATFDLYRPIPMAPLRTSVHVVKEGRRMQLIDATLWHGERDVGSARALRIRTEHVSLPTGLPEVAWEPPPDIEAGDPPDLDEWGPGLVRFHRDAVQIASVGRGFEDPGPGVAWFRLRYPTVAGSETSPFVRLGTLADLGNGLTRMLDHEHFVYVNPDVTLYAARPPESEWIGLRGHSRPLPIGIGFADSELFDEAGPLGRISQAQLIAPRE